MKKLLDMIFGMRKSTTAPASVSEITAKIKMSGSCIKNDQDIFAELAKLRNKLKHERQLRVDLENELSRLSENSAELERKYRALLLPRSVAKVNSILDEALQNLIELAQSKIDQPEIEAKIAAYHATLDKKGYDHVWRERLSLILKIISTGEFSLPRALAQIRRAEERKRKMGFDKHPWIINDRLVDLPWRPAASAYRSAVFEAVIDQVKPNTRKIIETGSGWGEHLCNIFLEGGPVDATYYACEPEEEGRKCALLLASLDKTFRLEAYFFDYCNPDWAKIPCDNGHTILLTAHSIEQVAEIHPHTLYGALELSREVTGIHLEPIGWQTYSESDWTDISHKHHKRCTELHYNRNLWPLLYEMQDKGLIVIDKLETNFIGLDYNPATLIVWQKIV